MGSSYQIRLASASPTALNSTIDASTPSRRNLSTTQRGGNGVIRGTTRRQHAANQLLMLQNPHRSQPRAPCRLQDLSAGLIGAKKLAQHSPFSSISAKKFAQHSPSTGTSAKKFAQHRPSTGTSAKKLAQQA